MVRVDDPDRVFDVSRPGRSAPGATSRPLIMGHHPQSADPMVNEHPDDPYADFGAEKKVTSVPVTWDASEEAGSPTPIADHPESAEAFQSTTDHAVATEPEVETETKTAANNEPPNTDTLFAPDHNADKSSWTGDGHPPINALPLGHSAGAGPRRSWKKITSLLAGLLVLAGIGAYLAIDAGLVGANIKLPFEFFKEKQTTPAVTTTQPPPKPAVKELPSKTLPAFTLTSDWTEHELKTADLKLAYPKTWTLESTSELGVEDRFMSSPDFKYYGVEGQSPFEGGRFSVMVKQTDKQLDDYKAGDQAFTPTNIVNLDGKEGVFGTCNATNVCVYVLYLGREYFFAYAQSSADEVKSKTGKDPVTPKDKYLEDFLKLLASVRFTEERDG